MARRRPSPRLPGAASVRRRLLAWWDAGRRDLPWRYPQHAADPYRVWLAEVMLQQTRVAAALPYYRNFVARWPTLEALAGADDAEVLAAWSGLGYYARCRNLLLAARTALARHGGLPASHADLRRLPGFGPYTAGAVASVAFAIPEPAVDGNAVRVLSRLFLVDGDVMSPAVKRELDGRARSLLDPRRPGDLNQAVMELGARVCIPRRPRCGACPLARSCAARKAGREGELPRPRRRPAPVTTVLALVRIERAGRLLLARADEGGLFPGMWGLPGVAVAEGRDPASDIARALAEQGLTVEVGAEVATLERVLTHRRLLLRVHAGRLRGRLPSGVQTSLRFTTEEEASRLPASIAMRRAIEVSGGWSGGAPPVQQVAKRTFGRDAGRP